MQCPATVCFRKMPTMKYFYSILLIALSLTFAACTRHETADRIYIHAKIWTGDSANAWTEALAIKGNRILFTGKDYQPFVGANTQLIDLQGKMMVPGFIDNHTHFLSGGYRLAGVNLRYATSPKDFMAILSKYVHTLHDTSWILGGDWDHETWGGELPRKSWVDSITGSHPAFINRYDDHMALANTAALQRAGITKQTPDPEGGTIIKDAATGEPTGMLKDAAMDLLYNIIPDPSEKELAESLQRAVQEALSHGITQVHDMSSYLGWTDLKTYRAAYAAKKLDVRIYSFVPIDTWQKLDSFIKKNGRGDDMLRWGGLKGFVDGSLGSTTAWFYKPYLDAPNTTGLQVTDTAKLRKWIEDADAAGLQVADHAIGDRAIDWVLGVYEEAENKNGKRDRRFRIEHAQHVSAQAITKFAALQVIPSMQPYHAIDDGKWAAKRLDSARLKRTYAFKTLLDAHARVTFGSDWTVAPLDPIAGIYAAVTRRTLDGKNPNGWFPGQKISLEQALRCYTVNNAYAGFQENKTGKLKAGMLADFTVLSENLFDIKPEDIRTVKVMRTVVDGREVYHGK